AMPRMNWCLIYSGQRIQSGKPEGKIYHKKHVESQGHSSLHAIFGKQGGREMGFSTIESAIEEIRQGKIVIVVDDEDRENEGDFIMAAEKCTPELMNLFIRYGSGYVCAPTTGKRLAELDIPMMVGTNTSRMGTAMTVAVDARFGTTTGVSAHDRSTMARLLADPKARAS